MTHSTIGTMPNTERRIREHRSLTDHLFSRADQGLRVSWSGINGRVPIFGSMLGRRSLVPVDHQAGNRDASRRHDTM